MQNKVEVENWVKDFYGMLDRVLFQGNLRMFCFSSFFCLFSLFYNLIFMALWAQMLRVRLEKMSSYVGSLAASRVHHDRKVQFFGWNIEMPSQVCCGMLLQFFDRKKQGKVRGFGEWVKSVFEAAANARPESEEDMMLSQKPGFS